MKFNESLIIVLAILVASMVVSAQDLGIENSSEQFLAVWTVLIGDVLSLGR